MNNNGPGYNLTSTLIQGTGFSIYSKSSIIQ